jgi:hypothetical protein
VIETPISKREENYLREVNARTDPGQRAKAGAIVAAVDELGPEPFHVPAPLPPIREEQIHPICWMAVEKEQPRA